jgi:hypothetical protein
LEIFPDLKRRVISGMLKPFAGWIVGLALVKPSRVNPYILLTALRCSVALRKLRARSIGGNVS